MVLDVWSRKTVGWTMESHLQMEPVRVGLATTPSVSGIGYHCIHMQSITAGTGNGFTIRYPIDLANGSFYGLALNEASSFPHLGRPAEIYRTHYGALIVARNFASEGDARVFGAKLNVAARFLSLERWLPIFTEQEPTPIEVPNVKHTVSIDDDREIYGVAPETFYTIIPEDRIVMSLSEIRGNGSSRVPVQQLFEASSRVNVTKIVDPRRYERVDTACNFWSLACLRAGEIVELTNIVAGMEVLSQTIPWPTKMKPRQPAVEYFIANSWPQLNHISFGLLKTEADIPIFCKQLYRRRNEMIHNGSSPGTNVDVTRTARELLKRMLLLALANI